MAAAKRANITNLGHAAAVIRLQARRSIRKAKGPSTSGTPPHTRKGRLRNAIKYAVSKSPPSAVIGPDAAVAGTSGKAHEFGGKYKRQQYDRRPFMLPALEKTRNRLPSTWANSVKG
jgi:hypothetical protein